jgi:ankyrin repeat protein
MGDTPLSIAARHNRDRICRILLSHRETNINHRNDQGGTPLHYSCAAIVDSPICVELLVKMGAKVNVQDHKKNTPAMVASFFNKPKILQFLIEKGVDLLVFNNEDKTALDIADEKDYYECRMVINRGLERIGIFKNKTMSLSSSNILDSDDRASSIASLSMNFEVKNRIKGSSSNRNYRKD